MSPVRTSQMLALACFSFACLPAVLAMRSTNNDLREMDHAAPAHRSIRRSLEDGLDYLNHIDQPQEAKAYLRTRGLRAMPWPGSQGWISTFENAVKALPSGVETDDHQGTPIGEGESIGLMAATMQMDADQLQLLPSAFQKGLFATCPAAGCSPWPVALRVSHTNAADLDLLRIAMKISLTEKEEANLLFTETLQSFPIADAEQLEGFVSVVKAKADYTEASGFWGKLGAVGSNIGNLGKMLPLKKTKANSEALKKKYEQTVTSTGAFSKTYHSLTPYRIGDSYQPGAMKFRLKPLQPDAEYPSAITEGRMSFKEAMRQQVVGQVQEGTTQFEFQIQVATDPNDQPLNDANAEWSEASAPWVTMGRVTVPKQEFVYPPDVSNVVGSGLWTDGKATFNSKELVFPPDESPHTPLGDINLFRSYLYRKYDFTRQEHLLGKSPGWPAKCPFANMAAALGGSR